jgi:two-component system, NtrC family, response regulator HydG
MTGRSSEPRLVAVTGLLSGEVFPLDRPPVAFGRDLDNTISIPDPALSRRHCVFTHETDGWKVRDLGSSNGTFVNGGQIKEQALTDGDRIVAGGSVLLFVLAATSGDGESGLVDADVMAPTTRLAIEDALYLQPAAPATVSRAERDLRALLAASTVFHSVRTEPELQRELLRLLRQLVPADGVALVLNRAGGQVDIVDDGRGGELLPVSRGVVSRVMTERSALLSQDVMASRSFQADQPALGATRALLCVPIAGRGSVLGAFYLVAGERGAFDEAHLQLATAVGHLAAVSLENVRHIDRVEREADRLHTDLQVSRPLIGDSAAMEKVKNLIGRVARSSSTVLISGQTGTGKELAARSIHLQSPRARSPFVAINCAALPEALVESELFGSERGAYTGAGQKKGRVELADGGTLFLDEVGELPLTAQSKLLRVLQERELERLGSIRTIKVDIRLVAATNRDLQAEVRGGRFREDLYFRLNVVLIAMPPLRERRDDIEPLADHFLNRYLPKAGRRLTGISPAAMACLRRYDWPGNVRELENAIERAAVLGTTDRILPEDLPEAVLESAAPAAGKRTGSLHDAIVETKKKAVITALRQSGHSFTDAARALGVHPNYLHRLVNNLGLRDSLGGGE